jgi:hypothetical protein
MRCLPSILGLALAAWLGACAAPRDAETPGIPLGAPGSTWAAKNTEQKFGYMAAKVHPVMQQLFLEYKPDNYAEFSCSNCHGATMEQIDYAMPNQSLYALPKDRAYDDAIDFDPVMSVFMMTKVTPALQDLFNQGDGPPTKVTCFNCHPAS